MRRVVLILPDLLGDPSFLRGHLPVAAQMAEMGRIFKLTATPDVETPEALFLGLSPEQGQLRQGPLTISALKADPPERSTHFHLSLMSYREGLARQVSTTIGPAEQGEVISLAKKLNTKTLTLVEGEGLDHGLVWESLGDLRTTSAADVDGKTLRGHFPEGDAELALRRYIDDSINLLSETEMNLRRIDEDLPPLNLLWPWGEGVRQAVPNLALRRGEPALVMSGSMRLAGLTRLAGYRHTDRASFGRGTNTRLEWIAEIAQSEPVSIVVLDAFTGFRDRGQLEEGEWMARELDRVLLQRLFSEALKSPTKLTLLGPAGSGGLGLTFQTGDSGANAVPFDERALEERSFATTSLESAVESALA